ncbi:MAG: GntR family transcriptional regulator [Anaerolineales bacterium]|nr:GntR family transcriptional regulator [Anaerolineales bacterium]
MKERFLYQQIVESVRSKILSGELKPGDRLPSIRELTRQWNCTPGTIQRAYRELAEQGLVVSRAGQGTHVLYAPRADDELPLRRAKLVHRAQAFLLEALTAGHSPSEVETALRLALDQWRGSAAQETPAPAGALRFSGSHDLALSWIAAHFNEIAPGYVLDLDFCGSLGGLIALAEGKADLAGSHLWDPETNSYNLPYVLRVLPGRRTALLTLAWRKQGLIAPRGNPLGLRTVSDLAQPGLRFVNRQPGSGTRVWLDAALRRLGIATSQIAGYETQVRTHSEAARAVAELRADAGFGLQTAALAYGLDFIPVIDERYDLVIPEAGIQTAAFEKLAAWLQTAAARKAIAALGGYDTRETGQLTWVE